MEELACRMCDVDHRRGSNECPARRVGKVVAGKYEILQMLGVGGMGAVYRARHRALGTEVALKMVHAKFASNRDLVMRFEAEGQHAARLRHPGIVAVTDLGRDDDGTPYLEMELLAGRSIDALVRSGEMTPQRAVLLAIQALIALEHAHAHGIVHRDIKPENLFVTHGDQLKVVDFGIAKALEGHSLTMTGSMMGTPMYMSPEQLTDAKSVTPATDVYSMGATLFEMLTGVPPIAGTTVPEVMAKVLSGDVRRAPAQLRAGLPAWIDPIVGRALARDVSSRYPTARAMREDLERGLAGGEIAERRPILPTIEPAHISHRVTAADATAFPAIATAPPPSRSKAGWIVAGVLVVGGAGAAIALTRGGDSPKVAIADAAVGPDAVVVRSTPDAPRVRDVPAGMRAIDGATFELGSTPEAVDAAVASCHADGATSCKREYFAVEQPRHRVTVSPFFLDELEVTNEQFAGWIATQSLDIRDTGVEAADGTRLFVMNAEVSGIAFENKAWRVRPDRSKRPMTAVSWDGANRYCASLGKRLPTEAEWDLAASGAKRRPYPWGDDAHPQCDQVAYAGTAKQTCASTASVVVGTKPGDVTPEGVRDLGGNVSEWTADEYSERYPDCGECLDPLVKDIPIKHVVRGGAYNNAAEALRVGARSGFSDLAHNLGFRCAR